MSFEIVDLCNFYFNIAYPNYNKYFEHSNQVRKLIFEAERERKSAGSLGMLGFGVCFGGTPRDYVIYKIFKMRKMQTNSNSSTSDITCNLKILTQTDG